MKRTRGVSAEKLQALPLDRQAPCRIGQTVRWTPFAWVEGCRIPGATQGLLGTVTYVNREHGYYTVEAQYRRAPWRESFKF